MSLEPNTFKVVVVTGATGGLGQVVMQHFIKQGFKCVGLSRRSTDNPDIWVCDVSDENQVKVTFQRIIDTYKKIDILVNCAAIASRGDDLALSAEEWEQVLQVNVIGTYLCCRYALPIMRKHNYGRIINISSIAGRAYSKTSSVAYTASKYAVIGLTRQLAANTVRYGVTVNCVAPSQINTPMLIKNVPLEQREALAKTIPVGRLGEPDEVTAVIAFLSGENSSYVNGAIIDVNGGQW